MRAIALMLVSLSALADPMPMGKDIRLTAPFCMSKESMIAVAQADNQGGQDAAMAVFKAKPDCAIGQGTAKLTKIILEVPTARGDTVRVIEIEIASEGLKFTVYMLSDVDIDKGQAT